MAVREAKKRSGASWRRIGKMIGVTQKRNPKSFEGAVVAPQHLGVIPPLGVSTSGKSTSTGTQSWWEMNTECRWTTSIWEHRSRRKDRVESGREGGSSSEMIVPVDRRW